MSSSASPPQPPCRSVVVATLDDNLIPNRLAESITKAARETIDQVTIVILSERFAPTASQKPSWGEVQDILTSLYILASKEAQSLDKVLLNIDVLLKGPKDPLPSDLADGDALYHVQTAGIWSPRISRIRLTRIPQLPEVHLCPSL